MSMKRVKIQCPDVSHRSKLQESEGESFSLRLRMGGGPKSIHDSDGSGKELDDGGQTPKRKAGDAF